MDISISNPKEDLKYINSEELIPGELFLFVTDIDTCPPNDRVLYMCGHDHYAISLDNGYTWRPPKNEKVYRITKYKFEYEAP